MSKKLKFVLVFVLMFFVCAQASFGQGTTFTELEKQRMKEAVAKDAVDSDSWIYTSLKTISDKYGLLMDPSDNKFKGNRPITRNEAALLLVNLTGKIEQDRVELTQDEKTRIDILKSEFNKELKAMAGRIDKLETSVQKLEGTVSKIDGNNAKLFGSEFGSNHKVSGAIQVMYNGNFTRGDNGGFSRGVTNTRVAPNFSIPVADISLKGNVTKNIDYFINTFPSRNFNSTNMYGNSNSMVGDAWLGASNIRYLPGTKLLLGQTRKPLGIEGSQSPYSLETIYRSQIARNIGDKRDVGLTAKGSWKFVDYMAGAYNGYGDNARDNNAEMEYVAMATVNPLYAAKKYGAMKIGGVYDNNNSTRTQRTYGMIAQYTSPNKKLLLQSEYMHQRGYTSAIQKASGWYAHGSYYVTPKLQVVARFDTFDGNLKDTYDYLNEYTLGTNYYFFGNNLKLQTNLVYVQNKNGQDSKRIMALTQYKF